MGLLGGVGMAKLTRLFCVQPPTAVLPKRLFKTRHKNLPCIVVRRIAAS